MDYLELLNSKAAYLVQVETLIRDDLENEEIDRNAATQIQKCVRSRRERLRLNRKRAACIRIQSIVRGHLGRKYAASNRSKLGSAWIKRYLGYFALQIQRCYRGHKVRRHVLDFYARKRFLEGSAARGEELKKQLENYAEYCIEQQEVSEIEQRRHKLKCAAGRLHHLVGTQQQRGVFDPPPTLIPTPTIDSVPVEEYLRSVVRDLLRATGRTTGVTNATAYTKHASTGLARNLKGAHRLLPPHPESRLSVQASSHYDAIERNARLEVQKHKGTMLDNGLSSTFHTSSRSNLLRQDPVPLSTNDPFVDAYANPALKRGVPSSQDELNRSCYDRKAYFLTSPAQPFYTVTEGNKSSVLPNDLFDVIAEAEYTGGVIRQHQRSARFRLSYTDIQLPSSPVRVSTKSPQHQICEFKANTGSTMNSSSEKSHLRASIWDDESSSDEEM